jgi:hypothetical protein
LVIAVINRIDHNTSVNGGVGKLYRLSQFVLCRIDH